MRKRILFCIVSCLIICCIGCQNNDFGGRPTDYGPALWISEEPYIWFEVQEEVEYTRGNNPIVKGELTIDDEVYPCRVTFKPAGGICFYMESDWDEKNKVMLLSYEQLMMGTCKFGPDKLVVDVNEDMGQYYNGERLTFIRVPLAVSYTHLAKIHLKSPLVMEFLHS